MENPSKIEFLRQVPYRNSCQLDRGWHWRLLDDPAWTWLWNAWQGLQVMSFRPDTHGISKREQHVTTDILCCIDMCLCVYLQLYIHTLHWITLHYNTLPYNTTQHNAIHTVIVHLDTSDSLTIQRDGEKQFGTIPAIAIQLPPNIDASHLPSLLLWPASGLTG